MTEVKRPRGRPRKQSVAIQTSGQIAYRARQKKVTLLAQPKRIGNTVTVELSRAELHQVASSIDDLIARWPADEPLPECLQCLPRVLRKKVIRRGGTQVISVRMPKKSAYSVGGMLLTFADFLPPDALDPVGWRWLYSGAIKLLHAGTSRTGKRQTSAVDIDPTTAWRRQKKYQGTATGLLLGISE